jgi:hypothetical protein
LAYELSLSLRGQLWIAYASAFLISHAIVQDLPCHAAQLVDDRPKGSFKSNLGNETLEASLEDAAFGLYRRVGHLG